MSDLNVVVLRGGGGCGDVVVLRGGGGCGDVVGVVTVLNAFVVLSLYIYTMLSLL